MKVIFLDRVHEILEMRLTKAGHKCIISDNSTYEDSIKAAIDADGIVIRSRFKLDASFLKHATKLKFIARSGAGMENIDVDYCIQNNIELFNAPEGNRNAVAEHALGMLLALFNKLHTADRDVRAGKWEREHNRGVELDGKTVGIIGYGNNGRAFAQKLRGFDVDILAYDKYVTNFGNDHVQETSLKHLLSNADVISLHIPQNDETMKMINDVLISSVSKDFYLINLSRGKIVDTPALVKALRSGKIKGACLDVLEYEKSSFESFFDQELPEDFNFLLSAENVILSPHVGGWTEESYYKLSDVLADKIMARFP